MMAAANPISEVLKAINKTKEDILRQEDPVDYNAFVINRILSYSPDMAMLVNIINKYPDLPAKAQFDFLRLSCPARNRYHPMHKRTDDDDLEVVKLAFGYSNRKARMAMECLSKEQIEALRVQLAGGGRVK